MFAASVVFLVPIAERWVTGWKNWHGKWLAFSDLTYLAGGRPESPQRRRGRRTSLVYLVWVAALAGVLGITVFSTLNGIAVNLDSTPAIAIFGVLTVEVFCFFIV